MEVAHTEWKMLGETINRGGVDRCTWDRGIGVGEGRIGCREVFGKVIEDRH